MGDKLGRINLKASKKPIKRYYAISTWYSSSDKQIVSKWVSDDIYLHCPIVEAYCSTCPRKCFE